MKTLDELIGTVSTAQGEERKRILKEMESDKKYAKIFSKDVNTLDDLIKLCNAIPEKKDFFFSKVFGEYAPFEHVLSTIAKKIKTAPQLMALCETIPEKKDFFFNKVLNEYAPFQHALSTIAKEIKTVNEFMQLCGDFPTARGTLIKKIVSEDTPLREELFNEINNIKTAPQSHRETIFQVASALGCIDVIKVMKESCHEQQWQALISDNDYSAYRLAALHQHMDVLDYLEDQSPNMVQKMIESNKYEVFLQAAKQNDVELIQHFLEFPFVQAFAEKYCGGVVRYPDGGVRVTQPASLLPDHPFISEQVALFNEMKVEEDVTLRNLEALPANQKQILKTKRTEYIDALVKCLDTVYNEQKKTDHAQYTGLDAVMTQLHTYLKRHQNDKISLSQLKQKTQIILESTLPQQVYAQVATTDWLIEKISAVLRAFFHACDKLQALFTGNMIGQPGRPHFFSQSAREESLETLNKNSQEFFKELADLELEIAQQLPPELDQEASPPIP